jgi:hypothetical protein
VVRDAHFSPAMSDFFANYSDYLWAGDAATAIGGI